MPTTTELEEKFRSQFPDFLEEMINRELPGRRRILPTPRLLPKSARKGVRLINIEYASLDTLIEPERRAINHLLDEVRTDIIGRDISVSGFNVGINNGEAAGQTIDHAHVHLIPRRQGDVQEPRGGVRCVIPGKAGY